MGRWRKKGKYIEVGIARHEFETILEAAFRYAVISLPFTVNRMGLNNLPRRIQNIAKGKVAEAMVKQFMNEEAPDADFTSVQTPFYQTDRRDFLWQNLEWDIKNNYLKHNNMELTENELDKLPALVPARHQHDQWYKREDKHFEQSTAVAFLFTFMVGKLQKAAIDSDIIEVNLQKEHEDLLLQLCEKYRGKNFENAPFDENRFWNKWEEITLPYNPPLYRSGFIPNLYLTAVASTNEWQKFTEKTPQAFAGGMFRTRIVNQYCPVNALLSFTQFLENN
ncbi:hypothetical protein GC194_06570 [bacterium]|nr:hypothetical protein [bacterium]